jgi:hypothetical protein
MDPLVPTNLAPLAYSGVLDVVAPAVDAAQEHQYLPGPDMQRIRCMNLEHLVQIAGPRHLLSLFEVYKEGLIV